MSTEPIAMPRNQRATLPELLVREIVRVAVLREHLVELTHRPEIAPRLEARPLLALTAAALARAIAAAGSDDAAAQLRALRDLQGFKE